MINKKMERKTLEHVDSDIAPSDKKKHKNAEGSRFKDRKTPKSDRKTTKFKQMDRKSLADEAVKAEVKPKSSDIKSRLENTLKIVQNKRNATETPNKTDVEPIEKKAKEVSDHGKSPKKRKYSVDVEENNKGKVDLNEDAEKTNDNDKKIRKKKKQKLSDVQGNDKDEEDVNENTDETNDMDKKKKQKHSECEDDVNEEANETNDTDKKVSKKRKKAAKIEEKHKSHDAVKEDETNDTDKKGRRKKKRTTEFEEKEKAEDANQSEEDPEKAAIRKKKREKRRQKKIEKELQKQKEAERAGTAKPSALEYLETWKNDRKEWKFVKVRQCWLLQHMYDQSLIDDEKFETVLEYLEGCTGKAREVTVTEAENYIKSLNNDDDKAEEKDDEDGAEEKKPEPIDEVKLDRAKQVIQLLSI